ncbi:hypothetical protein EsH8_II_000159 [Colletotrichum jinshuiense]
MNRSIEQTLLSLMPTHSSDLPPPLVELAGSLLAQSRHRASTLKADEEVGRLYACAHIACDRLKITLDLPPIEPRPPIPPRIYKRLYSHLDNILPNTALNRTPGKNGTPRNRQRHGVDSPVRTPHRATPTKDRSLSQFRSGNVGGPNTPTKSTGKVAYPADKSGLHFWIQPTIRFLCKETDQKHLGPTILAGMEYIVVPGGRRTRDMWVRENLAALCGAIYFFVTEQAKKLATGADVDRDTYVPTRKEILDLLGKAREVVDVRGLDEEEAWEGWTPVKTKDFDAVVQEVTDRGWLEADWYQGLGDVIEAGNAIAESHRKEEDSYKAPVRGADTMFQDRYDFLSEKKRREYRIWKDGILRRIDLMEKDTGEAMEVDG